MTIDQWHAKVESMTADELKAYIEALDTRLADMDTQGQPWPASFEYHSVLQQKRDCLAALAALAAADTEIQLKFTFSGDAEC